jgi:hypothetical protein
MLDFERLCDRFSLPSRSALEGTGLAKNGELEYSFVAGDATAELGVDGRFMPVPENVTVRKDTGDSQNAESGAAIHGSITIDGFTNSDPRSD